MASARPPALIHVYLAASCAGADVERLAVIDAVLAAGQIPGGAGAIAGEIHPEALRAWLRRSDLFLAMVAVDDAGGTLEPGLSRLEWELAEARALGLPIILIVLSDRLSAASKRRLPPPAERERLAALRASMIASGAAVVDTHDQLRLAVLEGVARYLDGDRPRWVREDGATIDRAVAEELARLSARAAALEARHGDARPEAPSLGERMIKGIRADQWIAVLSGRTVRDLRTRQPRTLADLLVEHAGPLALGVSGDKAPPLELWLHNEVGAQLVALGLAAVEGGRLALDEAGREVVMALALGEAPALIEVEAPSEETVVATSDSALKARITSPVTSEATEEKTNFWTIDAPAGRRPGKP